MSIFVISMYCFAFTSALVGFMIYSKRRDRVGKVWFVYSLLCSLWALGYSIQINDFEDYETALWASRITDAIAIFIPVAWICFIYEFLGRKMEKRFFVPILSIACVIASSFASSFFIPRLKNKANIGFGHFVDAGPAFHLFTLFFVALVSWGFILLISEAFFKKEISRDKKIQLRLLLVATAFGFIGGSAAFLPVYNIDLPVGYGALLMPFFPFLMVLAITRYRLLDIDEVIQSARRDKLAAIGTLAASINHEIRNPLYVIQGLAQTYRERLREGLYRDDRETIQKAGEILNKTEAQATRALDIMKKFALFAKRDVTAGTMKMGEVDLSVTLDNLLPLIQHELNIEKIEFAKNFPAEIPRLKADGRHVEEILFNLIMNACQAIKHSSSLGKIEIAAACHNGAVKIEVKDSGPGIPADRLLRIFEPFYTTKEEGTGLGLYVTKQLVERNGGKISVKSRPGAGTTFTLEFKQ